MIQNDRTKWFLTKRQSCQLDGPVRDQPTFPKHQLLLQPCTLQKSDFKPTCNYERDTKTPGVKKKKEKEKGEKTASVWFIRLAADASGKIESGHLEPLKPSLTFTSDAISPRCAAHCQRAVTESSSERECYFLQHFYLLLYTLWSWRIFWRFYTISNAFATLYWLLYRFRWVQMGWAGYL